MKLLFLCTHNACRSVLAESIARKLGHDVWEVASAGSSPAGRIHPDTLSVLSAKGLPTSGFWSKSWDDVREFEPDVVITVCDQADGEPCPVWFGQAIKFYWGMPDPTKQSDPVRKRELFDQVVSTLEARLNQLVIFVRQHPSATGVQLESELARLESIA